MTTMIQAVYKHKRFLVFTTYDYRETMRGAGAKWERKYNCWSLPFTIDSYGRLLNLDAKISKKVHEYFSKKLQGMSEMEGDYSYKTDPREHQRKLSLLSINKKGSFYLCGVGTGKTKSSIDAAVTLYNEGRIKRVLVVCPASIIDNWAEEIEKHSHYESVPLTGSLSKRIEKQRHECLFHIINYEMIHKLFINIKYYGKNKKQRVLSLNDRFNYDMIIWDECHYMKDRTRDRAKFNFFISKYVKYKIGLTGTMIANSPEDAFMPYKIIDPEIFGESYTKFKEKYLIMGGFDAGYGPTQVIGVNNMSEFQKKLALNSLKYELDDVVDLPPEIEMIRKFDLSPATKKIYKQTEDEWVMEYEQEQKVTNNVLERMLRLSQIASGFMPQLEDYETIPDEYIDLSTEKLNELKSIFEEISIEEKIIIWCRFTHSIDRVASLCKTLGYSYYVYDGRQKDKSLYLKYNKDDTKIWIAQIQTGIGYSIPTAKYSIFYETDYSRVNHVQAKGRNRRLTGSEKGSCIYMYLQAKGTIDVKVFNVLKKKDFNASELLSAIKGGGKSESKDKN